MNGVHNAVVVIALVAVLFAAGCYDQAARSGPRRTVVAPDDRSPDRCTLSTFPCSIRPAVCTPRPGDRGRCTVLICAAQEHGEMTPLRACVGGGASLKLRQSSVGLWVQPKVKQYASTPASRNSICDEAVGDRSRLADQLVRALVAHRSRCRPRPHQCRVRRLRVDRRGTPGTGSTRPEDDGSHHEVDIARVELEGDSSPGLVQDRGVARDRPRARECPLIEAQPIRQACRRRVCRELASLLARSRCSGGSRHTSRVMPVSASRPPLPGRGARPRRGRDRRRRASAKSNCWMTISVIGYSPSPK